MKWSRAVGGLVGGGKEEEEEEVNAEDRENRHLENLGVSPSANLATWHRSKRAVGGFVALRCALRRAKTTEYTRAKWNNILSVQQTDSSIVNESYNELYVTSHFPVIKGRNQFVSCVVSNITLMPNMGTKRVR